MVNPNVKSSEGVKSHLLSLSILVLWISLDDMSLFCDPCMIRLKFKVLCACVKLT